MLKSNFSLIVFYSSDFTILQCLPSFQLPLKVITCQLHLVDSNNLLSRFNSYLNPTLQAKYVNLNTSHAFSFSLNKIYEPFYPPPNYGFNSIIAILLKGIK